MEEGEGGTKGEREERMKGQTGRGREGGKE